MGLKFIHVSKMGPSYPSVNIDIRAVDALEPKRRLVANNNHADSNMIDVPFITLRPRQNGRHFADDIFKRIFLNENIWIPIQISLKFVPEGSINNIPSLVQTMAWRHYLNQWWLIYRRIYASLGLNELFHSENKGQINLWATPFEHPSKYIF